MKLNIYVFEQVLKNKEDKLIKSYNLLKTSDYIKSNSKIVIKKDINTYLFTNKMLAKAEFSEYNGKLQDFNLKSDEDIEEFDGVFHALFVCITEKATYYNFYVAIKTPLGLVHKKTRLNPIILDENTIQF